MSTDPSSTSVDLADYVRVIRRQLWLIVLITLLVAGAAAAYTLTRPTTYVASAQVALPAATSEDSREQRLADVETEVAVMRSDLVAARAAEELGEDNARQVRRRLSVDQPTEARVMTVRFRAGEAQEARQGAQAFVEAYIAHNREKVQSQIDERAGAIEQQIDGTEQQVADAQTRRNDAEPGSPEERSAENSIVRLNNDLAQLNNQLAEVKTQAIDGGQVITPATTPGSPASRSVVRNTALGLLVGLALGLAAAFIRNRFDQEVGGAVDIAQVLGVPILGTIPDRRNQTARLVMTDAPESAAADAFRRLRASFLVAAEDIDAGVVGISSAVAGEGKSTVAANLAAALGQAGRSVVLISADLRRPSIAEIFDRDDDFGLLQVLRGENTIEEASQPVGELGKLRVLTSGGRLRNPADLLQSSRMQRAIDEARKQFEIVLVDTPPVLAVADTIVLAPMLDTVVMVVSASETTEAEFNDARTQLRQARVHVLGAVINRGAGSTDRFDEYFRDPAATSPST